MNCKNKVIVLTGAGSGIGRELALILAKKEARLALVDIHEGDVKATMEQCRGDYHSFHILDVSDRAAVEALVSRVIDQHGQVDGLINNAGIIQPFIPVNELEHFTIDKIIRVNLYGCIYFSKAFLPELLKRPEAHIINVSSMGGFIPFPGQTVYSASKAAVKIFTEGLYAELKHTSVDVSVVMPGAINTNIMGNSGLEQPEESEQQSHATLPASEAAAIIVKGIENRKLRILVGKDARALDLFYRFSPKKAIDTIVKKMKDL